MKKFVSSILVAAMCFSLVACEGNRARDESTEVMTETSEIPTDPVEEIIETTTVEVTEPSETEDPYRDLRLIAYRNSLLALHDDCVWPNGDVESEPTSPDEMSDNEFAIFDIDFDGKDELLIKWTTDMMADICMRIYEYDPATNAMNEELHSGIDVHFYDNGVILDDLKYLQGFEEGGGVWPYHIFQYDSLQDKYNYAGDVDSWCKSTSDNRGTDAVFPKEYDTDNTGVIYMIEYEGYDRDYYSHSEYVAFRDNLLGQAEAIEVPFESLSEANIRAVIVESATANTDTVLADTVNPDDYWDTDEEGKTSYHLDEYAEALGYSLDHERYLHWGSVDDYFNDGEVVYFYITQMTFRYKGIDYVLEDDSVDPDAERISIYWDGYIMFSWDQRLIQVVITALEEFSNPNSEWHTSLTPPEGWISQDKTW